jgi:hypothetical protein
MSSPKKRQLKPAPNARRTPAARFVPKNAVRAKIALVTAELTGIMLNLLPFDFIG